jgi:serine/threonine-protein kinase RIO1
MFAVCLYWQKEQYNQRTVAQPSTTMILAETKHNDAKEKPAMVSELLPTADIKKSGGVAFEIWVKSLEKDSKYPLRDACEQQIWRLVAEERLGSGASGVVHVACRGSDCEYIVKVMTGTAHLKELFVSQLAAEAGIGPLVHDAWVCTSKDVSLLAKKGPVFCMIQQRIEAPSLAKWMASTRPGTTRKDAFAYMMSRVLSALSKLHEAGIHHGDLTEENVYVINNTDIRFIDFGDGTYSEPLSMELRQRDIRRALSMFQTQYTEGKQVLREWGVNEQGQFKSPPPKDFAPEWMVSPSLDTLHPREKTAGWRNPCTLLLLRSNGDSCVLFALCCDFPNGFVWLQTRGPLPTDVKETIRAIALQLACPMYITCLP